MRVTHMLYADDLILLAYAPDAMQTVLNRLMVYARSKHLTINTAIQEVVHFNSKRGAQVPTFMLAGAALKCSDSFKYLGMTYHRTLNMTASSEHAAIPNWYYQCLQQLIKYVGVYGTLPYVTDLLLPFG